MRIRFDATTTLTALVLALALPAMAPAKSSFVIRGAGFGHGIGLSQYGADAYTRGLNVYLTLNSAEQMLAYRALRKGIMDYEKRQVYRGPEDYIDLPGKSGWFPDCCDYYAPGGAYDPRYSCNDQHSC